MGWEGVPESPRSVGAARGTWREAPWGLQAELLTCFRSSRSRPVPQAEAAETAEESRPGE